ncbi:MAG: hypothetical protein GIKADHBN_00412 [Phycisphaerales bacterium]|nr:hypothetical protein [Phycisphaerales bacterium]
MTTTTPSNDAVSSNTQPAPVADRPSPAGDGVRAALLGVAMAWCLTALVPASVIQRSGSWSDSLEVLRATPPKALTLGIVLALAGLVRPAAASGWGKSTARLLMQSCIVLAGLTMNVGEVLKAGLTGIYFTIATIVGSFGLGWVLYRLLKTDGKVTTLLSSGTAICGGSAIAAVSPVIGATSAQISVAMATVFVLNGVALYIFPPLGDALNLSAAQFGTWAGVAIHDTSSVYGAGQVFDLRHEGADALQQALAVKLSRALWIAPIVFIAAWSVHRAESRSADPAAAARKKGVFPWFIVWFVVACAVASMAPGLAASRELIRTAAGAGMTMALLLIGIGLSREALRTVGFKPMVQGVIQWIALGAVSLAAVWKMST